jgi:hypothetical protein
MIDDFGFLNGEGRSGRDDPARSSVIFSEWGSEYEEKDLASGGRSEVGGGRRLSPTFDEWEIENEEEDLASGRRR